MNTTRRRATSLLTQKSHTIPLVALGPASIDELGSSMATGSVVGLGQWMQDKGVLRPGQSSDVAMGAFERVRELEKRNAAIEVEIEKLRIARLINEVLMAKALEEAREAIKWPWWMKAAQMAGINYKAVRRVMRQGMRAAGLMDVLGGGK